MIADSNVLDKLRALDEVSLMELLDISSEDIVDAFIDRIEDNLTFIYSQLHDQD